MAKRDIVLSILSATLLAPSVAWSQAAVAPNYRCGVGPNNPPWCEGAMWTPKTSAGLDNSAAVVKNGRGILGILYCYNPNATVAYVQAFDALAANVTVGVTAPIFFAAIPATSIGGFGFGGGSGLFFGTGISLAATTTSTGSLAMSTALQCSEGYN